MAALPHRRRHQHHIKALTPTWFLIKATPPPSRDAAKNPAAASYSPLLLSPSVWQKAQNDRKSKQADGRDHAGPADVALPASPRISCMGQVKRSRGCSSARVPSARGPGYPGGKLAGLVMGLFGRRRGTKSRACSKVRDVPSGSSSSGSSCGRGAAAAVCSLDPPLPVVRRPARDDKAPSLWERRRGGGSCKALESLRLT